MDCIEDIRSLLQGVIHAQSEGAYSLENSEQIAPIVRRLLNRYPQLQGGQPASQPQQPVQQRATPVQPNIQPSVQQNNEALIKKINAEPNRVVERESNIETRSKMELNGIEEISLPVA